MRIIRAETQRAKDIELPVRKDRVLLFIRAVVETVMRNVPDPEIQEIIRREIAKLINLPDYDFDRGLLVSEIFRSKPAVNGEIANMVNLLGYGAMDGMSEFERKIEMGSGSRGRTFGRTCS